MAGTWKGHFIVTAMVDWGPTPPTGDTALSALRRLHHRHDARLDGFRQRRPSVDQVLQVRVGRGYLVVKCAGFCAALICCFA